MQRSKVSTASFGQSKHWEFCYYSIKTGFRKDGIITKTGASRRTEETGAAVQSVKERVCCKMQFCKNPHFLKLEIAVETTIYS